jgi:hypothetical protein
MTPRTVRAPRHATDAPRPRSKDYRRGPKQGTIYKPRGQYDRYVKSTLTPAEREQFIGDMELVKVSRDRSEIDRLINLCGQMGSNGGAMRKILEAL